MDKYLIKSFYSKSESKKAFQTELPEMIKFLRSNNVGDRQEKHFSNLIASNQTIEPNLRLDILKIMQKDPKYPKGDLRTNKARKALEKVRNQYEISLIFENQQIKIFCEKRGTNGSGRTLINRPLEDFSYSRLEQVERFRAIKYEGSQGITDNIFLAVDSIKNDLKTFIATLDSNRDVTDIDSLWYVLSEDLEDENSEIRKSMESNESSPTEGIADYLTTRFKVPPNKSNNEDFQSKLLAVSRTLMALNIINEKGDLGNKGFDELVVEAKERNQPNIKYYPNKIPLSKGISLLESASVHFGFDPKVGHILFDSDYNITNQSQAEMIRRTRNAVENICVSAIKHSLFKQDDSNVDFVSQTQYAFENLKENGINISRNIKEGLPKRFTGNNIYAQENDMIDFADMLYACIDNEDTSPSTDNEWFSEESTIIEFSQKVSDFSEIAKEMENEGFWESVENSESFDEDTETEFINSVEERQEEREKDESSEEKQEIE